MCIHVFVMGYMPHDKRIDDDMIHLQKKKLTSEYLVCCNVYCTTLRLHLCKSVN